MAYFKGEVRSKELGMDTGVGVIIPESRGKKELHGPYKVLYLLHGRGDASGAWARLTSIERYANEKEIAVIMPEAQHSFYCDMKYGVNYFSYVAKELPALMRGMFNLSKKREDTFVMGLSMGGFGALKLGLNFPERFAGVGAFSSAVGVFADKNGKFLQDKHNYNELVAIFGPELEVTEADDLAALAGKMAKLPKEKQTRLFVTCGLQDGLLENNRKLMDEFRKVNLDLEYREWEGGHEWGFWDVSVKQALDYFLK